MASTILFFCYPDQYTVMDWRAWESLKALGKVKGGLEDTYECWQKYNQVCNELSVQHGVTLRELDKALWMYKGGVTGS